MGILTGLDSSGISKTCVSDTLDYCPFIWNDFQNNGYITVFAEDAPKISTFNYLREGFEERPTDYYLRPFILEAEKVLSTTKQSALPSCLGFRHEGEYVLDYALELTNRFNSTPYFGFFWTNTFSHNNIKDSSSMDDKVVEYLRKLELSKSVIFFFSDHGMRFGPTRMSPLGHYEERLPFMFIHLPTVVKQKFPNLEQNLRSNENQLTNPYDIYMTLQTILNLSTGRKVVKSQGCPNCQSLFEPITYNRGCDDIAIGHHWCMCHDFLTYDPNQNLAKYLANLTIFEINNFISSYKDGIFTELCKELTLRSVDQFKANENLELYLVTFTTDPNGSQFQVTIHYSPGSVPRIALKEHISRLNIYKFDAFCVNDLGIKTFCSC